MQMHLTTQAQFGALLCFEMQLNFIFILNNFILNFCFFYFRHGRQNNQHVCSLCLIDVRRGVQTFAYPAHLITLLSPPDQLVLQVSTDL